MSETSRPEIPIRIEARHESWPLREAFSISRGSKTSAEVVVVTLNSGDVTGRGECVPYARYGETVDSTLDTIARVGQQIASGGWLSRDWLIRALPAGAARNALDCALWDLSAKQSGRRVVDLLRDEVGDEVASNGGWQARETCLTISIADPETMARKARDLAPHRLLKLKLGGADWARDPMRLEAVRAARPDARIVIDANEGWPSHALDELVAAACETGVELIEQPLPAGADDRLELLSSNVPICADESLGPGIDLSQMGGRYGAVNIKLDKAGGLTSAARLLKTARQRGYRVMVGSMVSTSLSMAPAFVLAELGADWIDLDSPYLLARDRPGGMQLGAAGQVPPPSQLLWG